MKNGPAQNGPADADGSYPIDLSVGGSIWDQAVVDNANGLPMIGMANAADSEAVDRMLGKS